MFKMLLRIKDARTTLVVVALILTAFEVSAFRKKEKVMAFFQMTCETAQPNPCQQLCVDMQRGGFFCRCRDGYTINKNGMTCSQIHEEIDDNQIDASDSNHVISYGEPTPTQGVATAAATNQPPTSHSNNRSPDLNADGEVVIHDNDVVRLKSIDLTKGLPKLESDSFRLHPNTHRNFVPDWNNARNGGGGAGGGGGGSSHVYMDSDFDFVNIPEGGDDHAQSDNSNSNTNTNNNNAGADNANDIDIDDAFYYYNEDDLQEVRPSCAGVICQNNGSCLIERNRAICQCPLGFAGSFCEIEIEVRYPKFYGNSYLALPILRNGHKEFSVNIQFRPESLDGLLLFSGEKASAQTDFMSVSLEDGFVVFRFDCGTGPAVVRTPNQVTLAKWNRVVVRRVDNQGSVQLNDDHQVESTSQGDYSRITFRINLFVGGYSDMESVSDRLGTLDRFVGCVQEMVINGHLYDFREKGLVGESEFGLNVGECSDGVCDGVVCQHGGQCTAKSADTHVCLCPIGYHGDSCERDTAVHIPHFSGHSYLEFPGLNRSVLSFTEIEVVFKPAGPHGAILYNGFSRDRRGDFISLAMQDGHVEYRFDLGTGPAVIRSYEPLAMDTWHVVKASRTGLMGTLSVDGQLQVTGQSSGAYTQLTLMDRLYLGGHPNFDHTSKHANVTTSFTGCLQKVVVNNHKMDLLTKHLGGRNIEPCIHPCAGKPCMNGGQCQPHKDTYTCYCPLGYENANCEDEQNFRPTKPMFDGQGYLMYITDQIVKRVTGPRMDLQLSIRPKSRDGLIFWSGEDLSSKSGRDFIALGFYRGALHLRYDLGSGEAVIGYNETKLFDGGWHFIRIQRDKQDAYIEIDRREIVEGGSPGEYTSLNTDKTVYLGGMPDTVVKTGGRFTKGFEGCIRSMKLATDYDVKLLDHSHKGRNVRQCRKKYFMGEI